MLAGSEVSCCLPFHFEKVRLVKGRFLHHVPQRSTPNTSHEVTATWARDGNAVWTDFEDDYESFFTQENPGKPKQHTAIALSLSQKLNIDLDKKPEKLANYISLLKKLSGDKALSEGRHVHTKISRGGHDRTAYVGNCLIQMYGNCGSVKEAQAAFDNITQPNLFSWTALIKAYGCNGNSQGARDVLARMPHRDAVAWTAAMAAYTQHKQGKEALDLFYQMQDEGVMPDKFTFACALDACTIIAALEDGKMIHVATVSSSGGLHVVVETALITLYGECGSVADARNVFDGLPHRDAVCWNAIIAAFAHNKYDKEALMLFHQMQLEGIKQNNITYVCALNVCASLAALMEGQVIHTAVLDDGYEQNMVVSTALVNMYGKCGRTCNARKAFTRLSYHDVVSWTAMIAAFTQNGNFQEALDSFHQMRHEHVKPDNITFVCAVDACAGLAAAENGLELHAAIVDSEHAGDVLVGNALLNMYIKCGSVRDARRVFDTLPLWNVITWNAMLGALTDHGHNKEALYLFRQVHQEDLEPNESTYVCAIDACVKLSAFEQEKMIHAAIVESGYEHHLVIGTALVNMYGKSGRVRDARIVFETTAARDIVSWNAMITALVQTGNFQDALDLFHQMELLGVKPSNVSFVSALDACIGLISLKDGHKIHDAIVNMGHGFDVMVGTALVNMYGKCGCLSDARRISETMPHQDVVSCTSMIAVLVQNGFCKEALDLFDDMLCDGVKPDNITFICTIDACASLTAIDVGLTIHTAAVEIGFEQDMVIGTGLINMYGKCGSVQDANKLFGTFTQYDIGSWNAMLGVFALNGNGKEAKALFHRLQLDKAKPDCTTFICILAAFSHAGMVDDGWHFFDSMSKEYGLVPMVEHYVCMIDLLGRAGHLDVAEVLINFMPFQRAAVAWRCLLGACKIHGDMERGGHVANFCFELDANSDAPYVMLSNLYAAAAAGEGDGVVTVRGLEEEWHGDEVLAYL